MEKYDDGPTAGMIGTVFDAEGKAVQKPMAVGASYDRGKSGGFLLYEVDDLVALVAEEKPRDVLLLFDYKGNIWPRRFDGDREAMRRARTWYDESLPVVLAGLECPPDSDR